MDPMLKGAEALADLQELARTPNHSRHIVGSKAADIVQMVELYRIALAQNQISNQSLVGVREALALHRSMALSGELPTKTSEQRFNAAMDALDRVKSGGIEVATCCDCGIFHDRNKMKVMDEDWMENKPEDWTLMCGQCWQAALQNELGFLRVHAGKLLRVTDDKELPAALTELREFMGSSAKRWLGGADVTVQQDQIDELLTMVARLVHVVPSEAIHIPTGEPVVTQVHALLGKYTKRLLELSLATPVDEED